MTRPQPAREAPGLTDDGQMTYFGTYLTANFIDTASSARKGTDIKTVTTGTEKFVATSAFVPPSLFLARPFVISTPYYLYSWRQQETS